MLDAYIRTTCGSLKWLMLAIFLFMGPAIRWVCGFFAIGGGLWFIVFILEALASPKGFASTYGGSPIIHPIFIGLGCSLLGIGGYVAYELASTRMLIERVTESVETIEPELWERVRNWLAAIGLIAALTTGSWIVMYPVIGLEALLAGIALFFMGGIALGAGRWLHKEGSSVLVEVAQVFRKIKLPKISHDRNEKGRHDGMSDAELRAAAESFLREREKQVVVPFRRRN